MKSILHVLLCLSFLAPLRAEDEMKKWIANLEKNAAQMEEMATDDGTIEILSLYPSQLSKPPVDEDKKNPETKEPPKFHSYPVLNRAQVTDPKVKKELLTELAKSIRASIPTDGGITVSGCFNPRHGIIYAKGEKKVELLICFECDKVECHDSDQEKPRGFTIQSSAGPELFNAFLDKQHVNRDVPEK
ncbi:hypothetical protein [Luteolibacter soli]|uniref:PH domain-containing protein n=1 Tax=Luteolibacter soli TaxID=3135280 RepID=A0ABU9AQ75_9BACT